MADRIILATRRAYGPLHHPAFHLGSEVSIMFGISAQGEKKSIFFLRVDSTHGGEILSHDTTRHFVAILWPELLPFVDLHLADTCTGVLDVRRDLFGGWTYFCAFFGGLGECRDTKPPLDAHNRRMCFIHLASLYNQPLQNTLTAIYRIMANANRAADAGDFRTVDGNKNRDKCVAEYARVLFDEWVGGMQLVSQRRASKALKFIIDDGCVGPS